MAAMPGSLKPSTLSSLLPHGRRLCGHYGNADFVWGNGQGPYPFIYCGAVPPKMAVGILIRLFPASATAETIPG